MQSRIQGSLSTKFESLNPNPTGIALPIPIKEGAKQIPTFQFSKFQINRFGTLGFRIWDLFRISDFGFRIFNLCVWISILCFLNLFCFAQDIKHPVVSGAFYPANPKTLSNQIDKFLQNANPSSIDGEIQCLISPHAGYEFSGGVAAYGYKSLSGQKYNTVIIIAPSHYVNFEGVSLWLSGVFRTPLGDISVDSDFTSKLITQNSKIRFYEPAFSREHSLEVQLPFLQKVLSNFKIVPIIIGDLKFATCQMLASALKNVIGKRDDCLIVASSDLSHYHPYKEALEIDKKTLSYLENFDLQNLWDRGMRGEIELCGLAPVITTLFYAKEQGINKIKVLKYANSGDVTGDFSRVVGYASCALHKTNPKDSQGEEKMLNPSQRKRLLEIARKSMEEFVTTGKRTTFTETDPGLLKENGAFVTLNKHGQLRGCIGRIVADSPLYRVIADMAIEAATHDPRFYKVMPDELKDIEIEISVLSPLEKIDDVDKIQVGKHGLLLRKGFYSGLLLPQVATEYGWDRITFLEQTCHKAGLPSDAWKSGAQIFIFSALVFGEEKEE